MSVASILVILIGFAFSALFSGVETGSYVINRIRLRQYKRERRSSAISLSRLLKQSHIFIFTVLIGNNIAVYVLSREVTNLYLAGGVAADQVLLGFIPWNAEMIATLTLVFPLFFFAEVGPKNLFHKRADFLMYRVVGILRFFMLLFYPITWPLKQLFSLLTHGMKEEDAPEIHRISSKGLKEYFSEGAREGILTSHQTKMMDNTISMHEMMVRSVMTSFKEVPQLQEGATVGDLKGAVAKHAASYAVLMNKHKAIGLVSMFPMIQRNLKEQDAVAPYADDILSLRDNCNLKAAFYLLRRNHHHCAVVIDARSYPVGFISLEDIARYITDES